jgi:hypothetical protein
MQPFSANKSRVRRSSKPSRPKALRDQDIADSLTYQKTEAMVACTECVNNNATCYYDREQSVKCAECLRYRRNCDGTFSLEEFRRVVDQKRALRAKARASRSEVLRLRKVAAEAQAALAAAESGELAEEEELAKLEERSSRMLRREMQALGVMESLDSGQEVALADPDLSWSLPVVSEEWMLLSPAAGGTPQQPMA